MKFPTKQIVDVISHPNFWTMFRVFSIPGIVVLMMHENKLSAFFSAIIFCIAAATDFLDGFLARKTGKVSSFGKIMDPLADKLLVSSSFIMLVSVGWVEAWIVCVIIGREIAITGWRNIITEKGGDVSASWLGKYKTVFQITAIIPLLLHYPYFGINIELIGNVFLWIALFFTLWSGIDYFVKSRKLLKTY